MQEIRIGTRGSDLALWQANFIKNQLESITKFPVILKIIKTRGDKITNLSFSKMEGKGFFTKELEETLLNNDIDLAVHSLKDLQTVMPEGLALTAVGFREDNREALLIRKESFSPDNPLKIKSGGIIGSSSVRRLCQISNIQPDLQMKDLRGNVPTRVGKLRERKYDAIIIAYAGIKRLELNLSDLHLELLDEDFFLPAPAQGILGLQTRANDSPVIDIVSQLDDKTARIQIDLERGLMKLMEGGCQLPLGAFSRIEGDNYRLCAVYGLKENHKWIGLKRADVMGNDIAEMIEEAYRQLKA
ncbi:MAG: hydroxymethylbilane synthase [Candidatus Zixiibacteriota bacterium]